MYAANIDGTRYTFQASGALWQDALVMQDMQTESLWSQVSGEAIKGKMKGTSLSAVPSMHMTYAEFRQRYPEGVLLQKPAKGSSGSHYAGYFADQEQLGIFGRQNSYSRLDGKDRVVGLRLPEGPIAVAMNYLDRNRFALLGEDSTVVVMLAPGGTAVAAYRLPDDVKADKVTLEQGRLTVLSPDVEGHLVWSLTDGRSLTDHNPLQPLPLTTAFWFAWVSFFPGTDLVK